MNSGRTRSLPPTTVSSPNLSARAPVRILELPGLAGWKRHFKADCTVAVESAKLLYVREYTRTWPKG
eukprot:4124712-Prymnesium_polylepis.1